MLSTSPQGYSVVKSFEGRSTKAYRDEVGVWTIGYGNTNYDAEVLGFTIKAGVTITPAQCDQLLVAAMTRRYEPACRKAMGPDCTQPAFDAAGSFHYNTGAIERASWVKSFVAKNLPAVHAQITQWNKAGGRALAGLTRRRNREWEMISKGDYGPEGREAPLDMTTGKTVVGSAAPTVPVPAASQAAPATPRVAPGPYPGMMVRGDEGPEVKDEQDKLVATGYAKVPLTGKFEAETEAAVRDFQSRHPQLRVDGVLGPATKVALKRDANAKTALKATTAKGGGTATLTAATDQASGGHLPGWAYAALGVVIVGALCYTAWQYRDEIRTMLKSKFSTQGGTNG